MTVYYKPFEDTLELRNSYDTAYQTCRQGGVIERNVTTPDGESIKSNAPPASKFCDDAKSLEEQIKAKGLCLTGQPLASGLPEWGHCDGMEKP